MLDNAAIHQKDCLAFNASHYGVDIMFLPPYSPDYNPIEKMFGVMKAWFRANHEWVKDQGDGKIVVQAALKCITAQSCKSWIEYEVYAPG